MSATGSNNVLIGRLQNKAFRDAFVDEHSRTWLAYQIKTLREQRHWSQAELAKCAGKPQSVISRVENPDYGRFTLRTLLDLASVFDVALLVRFVAFGELLQKTNDLTPAAMQVMGFSSDPDMDLLSASKTISDKQGAQSSAQTRFVPMPEPVTATSSLHMVFSGEGDDKTLIPKDAVQRIDARQAERAA